jgi:hypothetical protein
MNEHVDIWYYLPNTKAMMKYGRAGDLHEGFVQQAVVENPDVIFFFVKVTSTTDID